MVHYITFHTSLAAPGNNDLVLFDHTNGGSVSTLAMPTNAEISPTTIQGEWLNLGLCSMDDNTLAMVGGIDRYNGSDRKIATFATRDMTTGNWEAKPGKLTDQLT